jgi:hypothetical protein
MPIRARGPSRDIAPEYLEHSIDDEPEPDIAA